MLSQQLLTTLEIEIKGRKKNGLFIDKSDQHCFWSLYTMYTFSLAIITLYE